MYIHACICTYIGESGVARHAHPPLAGPRNFRNRSLGERKWARGAKRDIAVILRYKRITSPMM